MGACISENTWEMEENDWEEFMIKKENLILDLTFKSSKEITQKAEFIEFEMDGSPFKNRVFQISDNDMSKPQLIFLHGNMAMFVGQTKLIQKLTSSQRIVGLDVMNLGLNTRSKDIHAQNIGLDSSKAESWIFDYIGKIIDNIALDDKFQLVGHSWGCQLASLMASKQPKRISGLFMLSPPCTEKYDPDTYNEGQGKAICQTDLDRYETKNEVDDHKARTKLRKHAQEDVLHSQPACLKKTILDALLWPSIKAVFLKGKSQDEKLADAVCDQQVHMLARKGAADQTMETPFVWPFQLIHGLDSEDRLGSPECTFSVGIAFGFQDCFASSTGAEDLLRTIGKNNENKVLLFKIGDENKDTNGRHNFQISHEKECYDSIKGTFDGSMTGKWENSVLGEHIK